MQPIVVVASLVIVLAAGCTDGPGPAPVDDGPPVITDPTDYSYVDPDKDGSGYHIHDYWRGQESLQVMDQTQQVGNTQCSGCQTLNIFRFRPDEGATIPQGAANITVIVEWQDNGNSDHGGLELWVKSATDSAPSYYADLTAGEPVLITTDNERNDPPHHQLSLWEFWFMGKLRANGSGAAFGGEATMTVEVEKGHEIPPWPPHPDHWLGADRLDVMDETRTVGADTTVAVDGITQNRNCSFGDCLGFHRLAADATIPWDATEVQATLRYEHGNMPSLPDLSVAFHGADTWTLQPLTPESSDAMQQTYRFAISPAMGDSPYAYQSLWEFFVYADGPGPAQHFTGSYTLEVQAFK